MERGKCERKLGRRLFGWKRGDEGFWWGLGVFFQAHQNPIFTIWRYLMRENKGGEGFLRKHQNWPFHLLCILTLPFIIIIIIIICLIKIQAVFFFFYSFLFLLVNVFSKQNKQCFFFFFLGKVWVQCNWSNAELHWTH